MATITGLTAERMAEIENASIIGANIVVDNLILTKFDNTTIDAGSVRGDAGPTGPSGEVSTADMVEYAQVRIQTPWWYAPVLPDADSVCPRCLLFAGQDLVFGDICYINSVGRLVKADADVISTGLALFIALQSITDGWSGYFAHPGGGFVRKDSLWEFTPGKPVYLSTTAGELTQTPPTGVGNVVQMLGVAHTENIVYWYPQLVQRQLGFANVVRTSGDFSTSSTSYVDVTGMTATVPAAIGDWLEVGISARHSVAAAGAVRLDVMTTTGSNYVSGVGSGGLGVAGWGNPASTTLTPVGGSVNYQVVSGDIASGLVALKLRMKIASANSHTLDGVDPALRLFVRNHGS